jgi:hypothetical protein
LFGNRLRGEFLNERVFKKEARLVRPGFFLSLE